MWVMESNGQSKRVEDMKRPRRRDGAKEDVKEMNNHIFSSRLLFARSRLRGLLILLALWTTCANAEPSATESAKSVLVRLLDQRASDFAFQPIAAVDGNDVYEIEASNGKVVVRGNSPVSMLRGAYAYLREACHCMVGWEGRHIDLPAQLPDFPKTRVVSPYQLRQDYNVCT